MEESRRLEEGRSAWASAGRLGSLLGMGAAYWLGIQPQVQRELAVWDRLARAIPDSLLRERALAKLTGERLNPEAAALFAALAPRFERRRMVSLIVAYQVLYDYLDGVNESTGFDSLLDGLSLHTALVDALLSDRRCNDYYLNHLDVDDGGYMLTLCRHCQRLTEMIPSIGLAGTVLEQATERCRQAQSHNHNGAGDRAGLIGWSREQGPRCPGYEWWEIAAGGISCLNIHAVVACAADRRLDTRDIEMVEAAYFPSICSLSALLDSLADFHIDAKSGNHSFVAHYRDGDHAAERMAAIVGEAQKHIAMLPNSPRHAVVLAGIVAYYISSPSVWGGFPAAAAERLLEAVGPLGSSMCAVMRLRRRAHSRTLETAARDRLSSVSEVQGVVEPARRAVLAPRAGQASCQ